MVRDAQGAMKVFVNRCAHRGAMLCVDQRGHANQFTCVYHNWTFDLEGRLRGVAFRHGMRNQGGLPPDFDFPRMACSAYASRCCTGWCLLPSPRMWLPSPSIWASG